MATVLDPNKTKIARRVIEVFEFFDGNNQTATVMDIVRRYDRPQSSTSELLASLVEMGLLYKDSRLRAYAPTPRLATLGAAAQPAIIRDGRLYAFMDRLSHSTRHGVALFGMVGTHVQVFRWSPGCWPATRDVGCGAAALLSSDTAGMLLMAALESEQARRMLWRLNAEAPDDEKFVPSQLSERIAGYRRARHATGASALAAGVQTTAALLPLGPDERPLAIGVLYPAEASVDSHALLATLTRGIAQAQAPEAFEPPVAAAPPAPFRIAI